jgi:micrococcal nuclease
MGIMARQGGRKGSRGVTTVLLLGPVCASVACAGPSPAYDSGVAGSGDPRAPGRAFAARVERVVDGDTFVALRAGRRLRVRLIGVDAPESVRPGTPVECHARAAARTLERLLPPGESVLAAYQPGGRRDRYGRELWDVWLPDGRFVQAALVRRGAAEARADPPHTGHADWLAAAEARARARGAGLHGKCPGP